MDGQGRFWHSGELVEHPGLLEALPRWISRHPDDGRYILTNGYDWTYFTVDDVPFFVRGISSSGDPELLLSDGTQEPFPASGYRVGRDGALYCPVKAGAFEARFTPGAQAALSAFVVEDESDSAAPSNGSAAPSSDRAALWVGGRRLPLP